MKLFKVTKWEIPEWGSNEVVWTKYFLAESKEIVSETLKGRYGKLEKYYYLERSEEKIVIEELNFEELSKNMIEIEEE